LGTPQSIISTIITNIKNDNSDNNGDSGDKRRKLTDENWLTVADTLKIKKEKRGNLQLYRFSIFTLSVDKLRL
jgi:hypothetical protein